MRFLVAATNKPFLGAEQLRIWTAEGRLRTFRSSSWTSLVRGETGVSGFAAAFIADQVAFMCTFEIPSFALETARARGTTRDYLDHVRADVLSSIPPLEAKRIVLRAAEVTRETGRNEARVFSLHGAKPPMEKGGCCNSPFHPGAAQAS